MSDIARKGLSLISLDSRQKCWWQWCIHVAKEYNTTYIIVSIYQVGGHPLIC